MRLYNTLTGGKEEFKPIDPSGKEVRLYTCGPTVYNFAHIGNLRAYVFADVLRRTLEYSGYTVRHVINITDVGHLTSDADEGEDKMVKALKREGLPMTLEGLKQVADKYTEAFLQDIRRLNIQPPHIMPRASAHIKEDVELIQKLEQNGFVYKIDDGLYFDTEKDPNYPKLTKSVAWDVAGTRIPTNYKKKSPIDFALWKFAGPGLPAFQSPFGPGFPGWHIGCSAMSRKYLGQPFDIHTGGIDHIPVHHQNEIAQSEAAYGVPLARFWMHNEFVTVQGDEKMAKAKDNFLTLGKLFFDEGIMPLAYRLWLLTAHYRQKVDFSVEAVLASQTFYKKVLTQINWGIKSGKINENYQKSFVCAIYDDLDTPKAVSLMAKVLNDDTLTQADKKATLSDFDKVLGLNFQKMAEKMKVIPTTIQELAAAREDARKVKDFKKSDELRDQIKKEDFEIMDTDSGPVVRKKL